MYLGLDLSLRSTGVCLLWDSQTYITAAVQPMSLVGIQRIRWIVEEIKRILEPYGGLESVTLAAIEGYSFGATGKTFHLGELGGVVRYTLDYANLSHIVVSPTELKSFFTSHGRADKVQMGQVTQLVYGQNFLKTTWKGQTKNKPRPVDWGNLDAHWRNDEVDAYALANVAAFYSNDWDRVPTTNQLAIRENIRLDPQSILSSQAIERQKSQKEGVDTCKTKRAYRTRQKPGDRS